MLTLLAQTQMKISKLEQGRDVPILVESFRRARPDLIEVIRKSSRNDQEAQLIQRGAALGVFTLIQSIPKLTDFILEKSSRDELPYDTKAGLLAALAYVIRPKDIIDDDSPGGYGYADDCLLLYATALEFHDDIGHFQERTNDPQSILDFLSLFFSQRCATGLQEAVDELATIHTTLRTLPDDYLSSLCQQLRETPLAIDLLASDKKGKRVCASYRLPDCTRAKDLAGGWNLTQERFAVTIPKVGVARLNLEQFDFDSSV